MTKSEHSPLLIIIGNFFYNYEKVTFMGYKKALTHDIILLSWAGPFSCYCTLHAFLTVSYCKFLIGFWNATVWPAYIIILYRLRGLNHIMCMDHDGWWVLTWLFRTLCQLRECVSHWFMITYIIYYCVLNGLIHMQFPMNSALTWVWPCLTAWLYIFLHVPGWHTTKHKASSWTVILRQTVIRVWAPPHS